MKSEYPALSHQITMVLIFNDVTHECVMNSCALTHHEYLALKGFSKRKYLRVDDVAERLKTARSVSSEICASLCNMNYIAQIRKPGDKRGSGYTITDHGQLIIMRCEEAIADGFNELLDCLPLKLRGILDTGILATSIAIGRADYNDQGFNLWSAYAENNSQFEQSLKKITHMQQLSLTEYRVLLLAAEHERGIRLTDICKTLMLKKSTGASALDALIKKGLAHRAKYSLDKRATLLLITPKGEERLAILNPKVEEFFTSGLKCTDDYEREAYGRMAPMIIENRRKTLENRITTSSFQV